MKRFKNTEYYITKDGFVFRNGKQLKLQLSNSGYFRVNIYFNKKRKKMSVHRMVAETYLDNNKNYPLVSHKNHIKTDNRVENLKWSNQSKNMKDSHDSNMIKPSNGENHYLSKLSKNDIQYIRDNYIPRHKQFGARALAKKYNVSYGTIYPIIHNLTWKEQ